MTAAYQILLRMWRKLLFRPVHLLVSFVQPLFWLTIFGFLFNARINLTEGNYISYLLPGILGMTILQTSAQSGIQFVKDFQSGFFGRYNFTSIPKHQYLFFKIIADYSRVLLQLIVMITIGLFLNVEYHFYISGILTLIGISLVFTLFYSSLSCFIALKFKSSEYLATFIHLLNLPIIFTSTALMPNKHFPSWLHRISKFNPLSHLCDILRDVIIEPKFPNSLSSNGGLLLIILMIASFILAWQAIRKISYD